MADVLNPVDRRVGVLRPRQGVEPDIDGRGAADHREVGGERLDVGVARRGGGLHVGVVVGDVGRVAGPRRRADEHQPEPPVGADRIGLQAPVGGDRVAVHGVHGALELHAH